jgi:hypothetical protein
MFFTSLGFSLDMHYCQDEIQSISIIGKAKSCDKLADHLCDRAGTSNHGTVESKSSDDKAGSCHSEMTGKECDKDCCQNRTLQVDNLEEESLSTPIPSFDLNQIQFVLAFVGSFYNFSFFQENSTLKYFTYKPPLIERDIQLLFQSFLI